MMLPPPDMFLDGRLPKRRARRRSGLSRQRDRKRKVRNAMAAASRRANQ